MPILVQLYNPHSNQEKIHNSINNEPYKYYVLNIARQFGKTMLAMNQAYYWAINDKGCKIGWVSPIYKQSEKVYDELANAFTGTISKTNASKLTVEIEGSVIQLFSSERYDNIRGFTFDYLIIDEAAWQQEEAWINVLRATVLVKGKKVLFLSTPRGKNWFYTLFQLGGINEQYKSFRMSSYDNPLIGKAEIDAARLTLPEHIFKQEYLAEFIDNGSGVFSNIPISITQRPTSKYYAGIDLGRADDYTVLTVLNELGEMVFVERWRQSSWQFIIDNLIIHLRQFKAKALIEVNSIGDVIYEQLKKQYSDVEPFLTTAKTKQDAIEDLQVATQNRSITLLDCDWLKKEFEVFTYEYNPKSRSIKYSAPPGFHDDGVMSTAIAYQALKTLKRTGHYSFG